MSQTVARRIPIGPVQVYFNDTRLGTGKSQAVLNWTYGTAIGRTGDNVGEINARKTNESGTVDVVIADLKASQLKNAFLQAKNMTTNTLMTNNYMASTTMALRRHEELCLTATGSGSGLASTQYAFNSGTVRVYSLDYETEYIQGGDFETLSENCDGIFRCTTGVSITSGQYVNVHYDGLITCSYVRAGGADTIQEGTLRLCGMDAAGKSFEFKAWRVIREGDFNITINAAAEFPGVPMKFRLLADVTNYTKGSQLFEIKIQA